METRTLQGSDWHDIVEVMHGLTNMITVRSHYGEGHPAIAHADRLASDAATRVLTRVPEIVAALIDGEFVICERPMPDLRERLRVLADAMIRHRIECIVLQRGMTGTECGLLGRTLATQGEADGRARERAQAQLHHVLLRFVAMETGGAERAASATGGAFLVPIVHQLLGEAAEALASDAPLDQAAVRKVAERVMTTCRDGLVSLDPRSYTRSLFELAAHATNVAIMTAAMADEAGYARELALEATAAALLHDIGHLLLPDEIRGLPEPLLDDRAKPVFRNHAFAGALVLLGAGCPPLWVAAALEHHRGVDGRGYPDLEGKEPPHDIVQMISLASYLDRKRTLLGGKADESDAALRSALALEGRYFGPGLVRRFVRALGVFPPGATVELSERQPAVVLRASSDPWRPFVKVLRGRDMNKRIDLRDVHPVQGRHQRSIVRAIAPPLFVPSDLEVPAEEPALELEAVEELEDEAPPPLAPPSPDTTSEARARAELANMGDLLDALLTVPTDALRPGAAGIGAPQPGAAVPERMQAPVPTPRPMPAISVPAMQAVTVPVARSVPAPSTPSPSAPHASSAPAGPPARTGSLPAMPAVKPPAIGVRPPSVMAMPAMGPIGISVKPEPTATRPAPPADRAPPVERAPAAAPPGPPAPAAPARRVPKLCVSAEELAKLKLDPFAGFVASLVDGKSEIDALSEASGMTRGEIERIVAELVAKRVITIT